MAMRPGKGKGPATQRQSSGGTPTNPTAVPTWLRFTFTHTDLQAAALTNSFTIYSAPARVNLLGAILKHTAQFAGTGITGYSVSLGLSGDLQRYLTTFDVLTAPSNTKPSGYAEGYFGDQYQFGAATSVLLAAVSTGANLDQSTAGAGTLWLLVSALGAP